MENKKLGFKKEENVQKLLRKTFAYRPICFLFHAAIHGPNNYKEAKP
jgi:hypothetical protein